MFNAAAVSKRMSLSRKRLAAAVILTILLEDEIEEEKYIKKRKRRVWVRDWIARRDDNNFCGSLLGELRNEDPSVYKHFVRMAPEDFDILLEKVSPLITKQDTLMRKAISAPERLALTLRYLATGDSFHSLMNLFRIPVCTISKIVLEVSKALYCVLKKEYLQTPSTKQQWEQISTVFNQRWNFPNCIGALDGKHILIRAPPNSRSDYLNYKNSYSIILMALVDAEYKFTYINVGSKGRNADSGVFNNSSLSQALENESLNVPEPIPLPYGLQNVPYVIVADDPFAMKEYLMKPYHHQKLQDPERIFNYRLSRVRRISENVFGILSSRFRVLRRQMELHPEKVTTVVLAICALHNFLMSQTASRKLYAQLEDFDHECGEQRTIVEGRWRHEENHLNGTSMLPLEGTSSNDCNEAKDVRVIFKNYFVTDGEVKWQYKHL